ncbi:MFS transporter [Leptolyngbya ohadii]|uniref:MFS transporter n=1 Tax=Leptolyngbya ohadii TaxID=1962290 RepID=UPI000B59C808|nr:MFS transporter [Leptolyngbya ohadii]
MNDSTSQSVWRDRALLIAIMLSSMLAPLNSTMIAVALPRLITEFQTDVAHASWLVTSYLIAMATLQPIAGKLGDRWGRRSLILGGLVCFGVASLAATWAPNLSLLIGFRLLQAVSGAIAIPNGIALVREAVPDHQRATQFGLVSSATSLAAAIGPPIGGVLTSLAGWRAIFFVNVLLILPALLLGAWAIPRRSRKAASRPFDWGGSLLLAAVLASLAGLLSQMRQGGLAISPGLAVGSVVALGVAFFAYEARHPDPIIQLRFFRKRAFAAANGAIALSNLAMYVTLLSLPILLSERAGWTDSQIGFVLAAFSGLMIIGSPLGGRWADRWGRRLPTVIGLTLFTLGLLPLVIRAETVPLLLLLPGLAIAGSGMGASMAGLQTSALESLKPEEAGVAAGVFSTSRYLGSIVGSSILAGILSSSGNFHLVFWMVGITAFLSVLVSLGLRDRPLSEA